MAFTTIDNPELYFQTKLYTGNGSTNAITLDGSENMQPDWVWLKVRSAGSGQDHTLYDSVRGATKFIESNTTNAEATGSNYLTSFDSNGFTLGNDQSHVNASGDTYVAWNWKAGTSFTNDARSTGIGSIDSTGSFNNDSGFSIVSYTGNNTSGATLKHGLNTAPAMVILRNRNLTNNRDTVVYHQKLTSASYYIYLNSTGAMAGAYANFWNNTAPNSSVITLGSGDTTTNGNGDTYIAYCFAEKQGYSKFGSYVGNGNATNNTFIYTGFKVGWVLIKRSSSSGEGWFIFDSTRSPANLNVNELRADTNSVETTGSHYIDFLSNGFKPKTAGAGIGGSGDTYIYMAFAENPFVTSTGVPATAR